MNKFVCFEDGLIVSVLDYRPNAPSQVSVVEISPEDHAKVFEHRTHKVQINGAIVPVSGSQLNAITQQKQNSQADAMLDTTDWMVLRHIRQKALGIPTSLSEDKYLELERQRQQAADSIQW